MLLSSADSSADTAYLVLFTSTAADFAAQAPQVDELLGTIGPP